MWLIVEVVPKATPFLLSIETMKRLGTIIYLEKSSCFLKALDRHIQLKAGKIGLLMVQIRDLCQQSSESHSIFGASSDLSSQDPFLEPDADSRRNDADGERHRGTRASEFANSAHDPPESGGNAGVRAGSAHCPPVRCR